MNPLKQPLIIPILFMHSRLILKGFKSIRDLDLPLLPFNILIGANGAGKSNLLFLGCFRH